MCGALNVTRLNAKQSDYVSNVRRLHWISISTMQLPCPTMQSAGPLVVWLINSLSIWSCAFTGVSSLSGFLLSWAIIMNKLRCALFKPAPLLLSGRPALHTTFNRPPLQLYTIHHWMDMITVYLGCKGCKVKIMVTFKSFHREMQFECEILAE